MGLARLLILERLPTPSARDIYLRKRREERGRPRLLLIDEYMVNYNIKGAHKDEVAD